MRSIVLVLAVLAATACGNGGKHAVPPRSSLVLAKPGGIGSWTKLLLSPDGTTYLGQWSGECEIQTAYLVSAHGGTPRAISDYSRGSAQSIAIDWAGSKARVQLPQGQPPKLKPGVYLVDEATMKLTLERPLARRSGC